MSKDINCPYCNSGLEICHDDGFGYEEGVNHEYNCHFCGKNFVFQTSIHFTYYPEKADCLNDGNHKYGLTHTIPNCFAKMECDTCGQTRELTNEERNQLGIESVEDFFERFKKEKEEK